MLLSLHARSRLGLVKDLAKGTIHIENRQLKIANFPSFVAAKQVM